VIRLEHVTKAYGADRPPVVRGIDLRVEEGELLVLLGASGCGKTTTLKLINRLAEPTSGRVLVGGIDVAAQDPVTLRRGIGYAFQGVGLFPHMTVADNVAVVPRLLGWEPQAVARRVDELLELVGLPVEARGRMPRTLSGGQAQRVGVARALAARPRVMLLDEPFGAVDPMTRDVLQVEYRRLHRSLGLTTVMVTHDMTEALLLADRIAVLHEGAIVGLGTAAELLRGDAHPQVEQLLGAPRRQAEALRHLLDGGAADRDAGAGRAGATP
jgi:osmoprotectant transport system ATP-binding protein